MPVKAAKATHCHLEIAALDPYCLTIEHGIRYLLPGRPQDTSERTAGNTHALGALLVLQSLQVLEAYRFSLFDGKANLLKGCRRHPNWPEIGYLWDESNTSPVR